jgi:hypothetical protein
MISWTRMTCSIRCRQCLRAPSLRVNSNGKLCRLKRHRRVARKLLAVLAAPFIASCGTYPLGTSTPARGQSVQQHQIDRLACKDEAQLAASTAGNQIVNGVLSATVLLEPIAYERDKSTQRAAFARCMTDRGYTVTAP